METRNVVKSDNATQIERFDSDSSLIAQLRSWRTKRSEWVENERPARRAMGVFEDVYEWFGALQRDGNKIELLVGDGLLRCHDRTGTFVHPVLLQKLDLEFDPVSKQPTFLFRVRESPPELYSEFCRILPDVDISQLAKCADELKQAEFAPLGTEGTDGFLRRLIQGLFPSRGGVVASTQEPAETPTISRDPVLFLRQRRASQTNIFDLILKDINFRQKFSPALLQILGMVDDSVDKIDEEENFNLGNEDEEILLSKPANREQLKIARQLAKGSCVLVQGPPGTGKTHTIANLLGHLLSEGKRVLVTAHTPKALRVLREKVVKELQPLCISVLQNDKKSQAELQASVKVIHARLGEDGASLRQQADRLRRDRVRVLSELKTARHQLLESLQDEIHDVVYAGKAVRPIEAAKRIARDAERDDWIPSPIRLGESMPLSHTGIARLYGTNATISLADERELKGFRPSPSQLPTPTEFKASVEELKYLADFNLHFRDEFWNDSLEPEDLEKFDQMLETASVAIGFLRDSAPWQLEAVQSGRDGEIAQRTWKTLIERIEKSWGEIQECHGLVMEYGPSVADGRPVTDLVHLVEEIIQHHSKGGGFGLLTKISHRPWFDLQKTVQVGAQELDIRNLQHLQATRAILRIKLLRAELLERWDRQMAPKGALGAAELGDTPEAVARQFILPILYCLEWNNSTWAPLEMEFTNLGFLWPEYLASTAPEAGANAELNRIRNAVLGDMGSILQSRRGYLRSKRLKTLLASWAESVPSAGIPDALVTQQLRVSLRDSAPTAYAEAIEEIGRLANLEGDFETRSRLLEKLASSAPAWASALENRIGLHGGSEPPGHPENAWEWRQFHDELERRATVSLNDIQMKIEDRSRQLLDLTSQLSEAQTWEQQIKKTKQAQKQALGAYATMRGRLTQTGKGVRDAEFRAAARKEMQVAREAVPVWIMPLAEVAETFDPATTHFNVVIIDEASQCDPTSMYAMYLADQTIIVGDSEQVTPVQVGVQTDEVKKLIQIYLEGIEHKELYDGETSIYELSEIAFGSVVRLTEHFRCAPNIISFSNNLSYNGDIRPLREASSICLTPHVLYYRVEGGEDQRDNTNIVEAEAVASLICAAVEQPEYRKNEQGEPVSFGVISLVGDRQALRIDGLLRQHLNPMEYQRRQILCGDAAQFQGDERDVMFLSVVDSPAENPPHTLRQEGPKKIFKKRYNVAASRARNQMWVVSSLNHETDLQPLDYRRRIIEHALDPEAWERELQQQFAQVDSNSKVFEGGVLRRLMEKGYKVFPQYQVGAMRIDLVVAGGSDRLAIECDGEQFHGPEKLQEDIDRQAVLERLGWKFVRIRGSLYFRDADRAMDAVFRRLEELQITPDLRPAHPETPAPNEVADRVIRRAQEIRTIWAADRTPQRQN